MKTNAVPFDQNAIGAGLALTVNDTILQTSATVDAHRHARSKFGQGSVKSAVEFYLYSPNAVTPSLVPAAGVPPVTVGIVYSLADLSKYVGEDAYGIGYCPGDGNVYQSGASIATFPTCALNSYIGVMVDFVALSVTFYVVNADQTLATLGSVDIPASTDVWYAATVSGNPGDLGIWANAGQTPLRSRNLVGGWYHLKVGIEPIYLATEPYISSPTDLVPHFKYNGDIDWKQSQISITRGVRFWPWGPSAPVGGGGSQIQFTINDPKKIYGELLTTDIRDQLALFSRLPHGGSFDSAQNVFSAIIDHCEQPTDQTKVLHCKDKLVLLQSQLIRAMFPPNADPSVAGKPRPMSIGICRTHTPYLYDAALNFAVSDTPIKGIGKSRQQGKEEAYGIDETITPDAEGFNRPVAPAGKWTVETTDFGGAFDPNVTDLLNGDGDFGSVVADGGGAATTSISSVLIGTGSKVFLVNLTVTGVGFKAGDPVTVAADSANTMTGTVTSFSGNTLTLNIASVTGSGTFAYWSVFSPVVAHSTTSKTIGTGTLTLPISTFAGFNADFVHSCPVTVSHDATHSMTGTVTSYSGGNLVVNVTSSTGSGTFSTWYVTGGIGQPHNWMGFGGYPTTPGKNIFQVQGTSPNKYIEQEQTASAVFGIRHYSAIIDSGKSIAFEVVVKQAPWYGNNSDGSGNPVVIPIAVCAFGGTPTSAGFRSFEWVQFAVPDPQSGSAVTYRGSFTNTSAQAQPLCLAFLCNNLIEGSGGTFSFLQIARIRLIPLPDLTKNIALAGPGLDVMLRSLLIDHGPLEPSDYDPSGAQAIDANGYQYGLHVTPDDAPQVGASAGPVLDSACADLYVNRSGMVNTAQLVAPEDATSTAGTLTVNDIEGYLQPYPDLAENLTTRLSGTKNYDPYTESDFSTVSQTDVPQIVRKLLQQRFQFTATANAVLASRYAAADNTKPLESQLDLQTDGQTEITRVCALYSVPRNFYAGTFFSDLSRQFEVGDVWTVVYPLAGLETGRQLLIVELTEQPTESKTRIVFWGL